MKLLKGMINMHNHALGLLGVDNELNDLQLQSSDIHFLYLHFIIATRFMMMSCGVF